MGNADCDELASELVRKNYAFVALFSVIVWDCLITFRQEVKYVWNCPSKLTKFIFSFCRYCAVGYFIMCSIFGTQWTPRMSKDCRAWFLIHVGSSCLIYITSQLLLIREVFNLYGGSTLLATGLIVLHCIQIAGTFMVAHHVSGSLDFNPICHGRNVPHITLSILASIICTQCITWALILRKAWKVRPKFLSNWRRYLPASEVHVKMSLGACSLAILFNASHSFASHRVAPIYIFTFPMAMLSVGTCRYILRAEKDRDTRSKLAEATDTSEGKFEQLVAGHQSSVTEFETLSSHNQYRHSYPPRPQAEMPSHLSDPEIQTQSRAGGHSLDAEISNYPYLHGAQSFRFNRNRRRMSTTTTNDSLRSSSDYASRRTVSIRTSRSRGTSFGSGTTPQRSSSIADSAQYETEAEETYSAFSIEIGSLHTSSSVDSEQLRRFYNGPLNVGPFMAI